MDRVSGGVSRRTSAFITLLNGWLLFGTLAGPMAGPVSDPPVIRRFSPGLDIADRLVGIEGENVSALQEVISDGQQADARPRSRLGTRLAAVVPEKASSGPMPGATACWAAEALAGSAVIAVGPPAITGFSPTSGAPGDQVVITGVNLWPSGGAVVRFNGVVARFVPPPLPEALELWGSVPEGATTGPISVETSYGIAVTTNVFTVTGRPAPVINSFEPTSGYEGMLVELWGSNLLDVISVTLNGVLAETIPQTDPLGRQFWIHVPTNATTGPITITSKWGSYTTSSNFTVLPLPAPVVTSFEPSSGRPGTVVMLYGSNLDLVRTVRFNGASAGFWAIWQGGISATVPRSARTGPITVEGKGGTNTTEGIFVLEPPPGFVISDFTPKSGPVGTTVRISGSKLDQIVEVWFGDAEAAFAFDGDLVAVVPTGATSGQILLYPRGYWALSTTEPFIVITTGDLAVSMTAFPLDVQQGDNITYLTLVTNHGPTDVSGVVVTNELPLGATVISASTSQGSCVNPSNPVIFTLGVLPGGATATCTVVATVNVSGHVGAVAVVDSGEFDPYTANNVAKAFARVWGLAELVIMALPGRRIELSWPVQSTHFVVQTTELRFPPTDWTELDVLPVLVERWNVVTDDASEGSRLYRLLAR